MLHNFGNFVIKTSYEGIKSMAAIREHYQKISSEIAKIIKRAWDDELSARPLDLEVSWECFNCHANIGSNEAKYWKGYYLLTGMNGSKDPEAALCLFKEAADNVIADARLRYA
ncbi:9566_t:CDS:2, partial [Dentiscutata heterogama]